MVVPSLRSAGLRLQAPGVALQPTAALDSSQKFKVAVLGAFVARRRLVVCCPWHRPLTARLLAAGAGGGIGQPLALLLKLCGPLPRLPRRSCAASRLTRPR